MNGREALEQIVAPKACFCVARRVLVVEKLDGGSFWTRLNAICGEVERRSDLKGGF